MGRNHRVAGVVRVVCTDTYHHDSAEYAAKGHHHLRTLRMAERADGSPTLFWSGVGSEEGPVKERRRGDGQWTFKFRCSCGRDRQRAEGWLAERVKRAFDTRPDLTRIDLDISSDLW